MQRRYTLALFRQLSMVPTVFVFVFVGATVGAVIGFTEGIAIANWWHSRGEACSAPRQP